MAPSAFPPSPPGSAEATEGTALKAAISAKTNSRDNRLDKDHLCVMPTLKNVRGSGAPEPATCDVLLPRRPARPQAPCRNEVVTDNI